MNKGDIWLLIVFLAIASLLFIFAKFSPSPHEKYLTIKMKDEVAHQIKLPYYGELVLPSLSGDVTVEISGEIARIKSSPCKNQFCVRQGFIKPGGPPSICLPERIMLEITGDKESYDALTR